MSEENFIVSKEALEPLFMPWDFPNAYRERSDEDGSAPRIVNRRRPSPLALANNLRAELRDFRDSHYAGVSETSRELLNFWFESDHAVETKSGLILPFRYYFCQREAIETLVYLYESREIRSLSSLTANFAGADAERKALGIDPDEDKWAKYAFKVATGAGKTKIMSLAIAWSYFHSIREVDSDLASHFVVIAPNLTVFERLKEDFADGKIFDRDPLIPTHWKSDWHMNVVLQDEASGATAGGTIYLTNIHRLYDPDKRRGRSQSETQGWAGPDVNRAKALDTGEILRERITSHKRLMVLNDEAHHVWDPDSAWNEAITYLNEQTRKRSGNGLVAQLDFSATPKDNHGNHFKHIVVDCPLGEAVDGGIVKIPIIGRGQRLVEQPSDNAGVRYQNHLLLGYKRWLESVKEWEKSGKNPLIFVMCEDTGAADQISTELNSNPLYSELNGKTVNLHTNLKGRVVSRGSGQNKVQYFKESDKDISDEDLKALRELSRRLDEDSSPYRCIVSVLMLREGWDVRNVTTIVPLRPYSSKANILPEQTLGRGLRRMTEPGQANETVAVVEHEAFSSLYKAQLAQEGLFVQEKDIDDISPTTVTIYPDRANKKMPELDLQIPRLGAAHRIVPVLEALTVGDIEMEFRKFRKLPLGNTVREEVEEYEGRHLFTNEIVELMNVRLPLLENGYTAVSFFREELEKVCQICGTHSVLAPLIQNFLEEILFTEKTSLLDPRLCSRLASSDVREHVRAVFVPAIRKKITKTESRLKIEEARPVSEWRPFQASHSPRKPAQSAAKTLFNLVPCNRSLEVTFTAWLDKAPDVASFCKNAGPQSLRIDYIAQAGRLAFYTPDFIVRKKDGRYLLVETKGREDLDVPAKAKAANAWCKAASAKTCVWNYLYVSEGIFDRMNCHCIDELERACHPSLASLLEEKNSGQMFLSFDDNIENQDGCEQFLEFIDKSDLLALSEKHASKIRQAIELFRHYENKKDLIYSPVLTPLLGSIDLLCEAFMADRLDKHLPRGFQEQKDYFQPYMGNMDARRRDYLSANAEKIKKMLIYKSAVMPIGILRFCLEYARSNDDGLGGIFATIRKEFGGHEKSRIFDSLSAVYDFRNTYVAHQGKELKDLEIARKALKDWILLILLLYRR